MQVAIDWGNTNTVVMVKSGPSGQALSCEANPLIPSYVQYDRDGQPVQIGWGAKNALRTGASHVVMGIKRLLGREWDFTLASHVQKVYGLETRAAPDREILIEVGPNLWLSPQQIAKDFFSKLREMILQAHPSETLQQCVATCPVQYLETHKAKFLHILNEQNFPVGTDRLLPEPQAVCLLLPSQNKGYTLVIDWGGGTLDLALVSSEGECRRLEGVEYGCGGGDMDVAILKALEKSNRIPPLSGLDRAVLKEWIEDRKERVLKEPDQIPPDRVVLPLTEKPVELDFQRAEVLQWIEPLLIRAVNAIRTSYWPHRAELRQCLLVGGPLQSPYIAERVQKALPPGCKLLPLPESVSQTIAVAAGAMQTFKETGPPTLPKTILVHDYGVAIDLFDHLLGTVLLQRGQACPVESPKAVLRPRGGPGTWVDVAVFIRKADLSERKYLYETSERFRILPQFQDSEAELEVQLIADERGVVSLKILDVKASLRIQLPQVGQQLTRSLCGPPCRSYQELPGLLLSRLWKKFLLKACWQQRDPDRFDPQEIEQFLLSEFQRGISPENLQEEVRSLLQEVRRWIRQHLPEREPELSPIGVPNISSCDADRIKRQLRDIFDQLLEVFALAIRDVGQKKVLPPLESWQGVQTPDIQSSLRRMDHLLHGFTGSEAEYQRLLAVAAELQAKLQAAQAPEDVKEPFSLIHQIVHFRYRTYILAERISN